MTSLDVVQLIGYGCIFYVAVVGSGIVLRWGFTGVVHIYRKRKDIDVLIREDLSLTLRERQ